MFSICSIFSHPENPSLTSGKTLILGFQKDEVFLSDLFSLHMIEQLIYSTKFLLNINEIFILIFLCALLVSYYITYWTDESCELYAWNATAA